MDLTAIGIIPARYASTRFPGKPLVMIHGKPMIQRVYEQASVANLTKVIVATDDERIEAAVKRFGGNVAMTSTEHSTGTERCAEAFTHCNTDADIVVNIQGDEPMVNPDHLNQLINCFDNEQVDVATLVSQLPVNQASDPNTVKVVKANDGKVLYFSRSVIPFDRTEMRSKSYLKHLGVYAYRAPVLSDLVKLEPTDAELSESLEQLRWLENGYRIHAIEVEDNGISIDTPEDLNRLLAIWKQ